jgi:hypothetical protein
MVSGKNIGRIFGVCLAAMFATPIIFEIHNRWPSMNIALAFVFFGSICVAFYSAGVWVQARDERNRKRSISGKELRKRKEEFYDWLASLGRR